ncbi:MAG: hypothetical protein NZM31_06290 [Gemmatales bacterium]|nr:hypothetical protein [Gemmatales bacterium]MDW8386608.1 multiheme c-type cytochrome [Gemmatales bacterium]
MDHHSQTASTNHATGTLSPRQRLLAVGGLVAVMLGIFVGGYAVVGRTDADRKPHSDLRKSAKHSQNNPAYPPPKLLEGPPPDLVLLLSGEMHGYLQPCGCARPQLGGLERRYELWKQLREKGWAVSSADLGELAPKPATEQGRIKFETALASLKLMNYAAVGLGSAELALPLDQALGIALNYQPPVMLCANLNDTDNQFPEMFRRWVLDQPRKPDGLKVAYLGVVGNQTAANAAQLDSSLKFHPPEEVLPQLLNEIDEAKPDLRVLLFVGSREEARQLVSRHPVFQVVVTWDISDEPSAIAQEDHGALFVSLGHKGKYVGLMGVYRKTEPQGSGSGTLGFRFQLVSLSPHFELPPDQTNPVREEMRNYVLRVYNGEFLSRYPKSSHPIQVEQPEARYVGAEACKDCHKKAYATWIQSKHAKAYENLVKYGEPIARRERKGEPAQLIGRQFDPDCVRCHATGFEYKTGFVSETATPHLLGNQCENCHGPSSLHVADPKNPEFYRPLRLAIGKQVEMQLCRKCHDGDNDPHFNLELYWPQVRHTKD